MLVSAAVACGASTSPDDGGTGTYNLRAVNGLSLPFTTISSRDASKSLLDAEAITVLPGGRFLRARRGRSQQNGEFSAFSPYTFSDTGTFVRTGTTVQFNFLQTREVVSGTLAGTQLSLNFSAGVFSYSSKP